MRLLVTEIWNITHRMKPIVLSVWSYQVFGFFFSKSWPGLKKKWRNPYHIQWHWVFFFLNFWNCKKSIYCGRLFFPIGEVCYFVNRFFFRDESKVDALLPFWCINASKSNVLLFFWFLRDLIWTCGREYLEILSQK